MAKYYTLLTKTGESQHANAQVMRTTVPWTHMALGDGGGAPVIPSREQTKLVNEVYRIPINAIEQHPDNPNWIIVESVIPSNVGGWMVRETAIVGGDGGIYCIAVGNYPETYKPVLSEGAAREMILRMVVEISSVSTVNMAIDPSVAIASRNWVEGFAGAVVDDVLPLSNYASLRAYKGRASGVRLTTKGIAGDFRVDPTDVTSSDNGGTIIVSTSGKRWKRVFSGDARPDWWGHCIDPGKTAYPYNPAIPLDVLRGEKSEKFALTLAKTLAFTDTPNFKLNARAKAAFNKGTVRVSIVGDSITAGADNWRSNSYASLLKVRLQQTFPWIKFQFSNLAIGGMSAGTLNSDAYVGAASRADYSPSNNFWMPASFGGMNTNDTLAPTGYALLDEDNWPTGSVPGKSWKQHIVDSDPDIIVWAFGMNDGTDFDTFLYNYSVFQNFIQAQMAGAVPWFVLVSCFLPDKMPPNGQPHANWQLPAQCMADQLKYLAKRDNYGHIDANAIFNLLRDGIRHDYTPFTHEANWRFAADASKWKFQPGFAFDAAASQASGTGMATRNLATRDIDFSATYKIAAFSDGNFVGRIHYRSADPTPGSIAGYSVDIAQHSNTSIVNITVYYKNTVIKNVDFDQGSIPAVGQVNSVKVKVHGDHHEIWLGSILALEFEDWRSFYRGAVQVGIPQGSGSVYGLGLSYTGLNVEGPVDFDRKWLLGTPIYENGNFVAYGDFISNPDSMGGNVVNHPTAWGHNTYYAFGIMRFVDELKQRINQPISCTSQGQVTFTLTAEANTPQKVPTLEPVFISLRKATKIRVSINLTFSVGGQTSLSQAGFFANDIWTGSSYLPWSTSLGGEGTRFATVTSVHDFSAGNHKIELGLARASVDEEFRLGENGTRYTLTVEEAD